MTKQHPINPPPELVEQWLEATRSNDCIGAYPQDYEQHIATQAARWGGDQELEACLDEVYKGVGLRLIPYSAHRELLCSDLRAARRPKPPSLKEQALTQVESFAASMETLGMDTDLIRRALQSLPS
jgi:hypothetical protein